MNDCTTDCRNEDGVTVGLVDSIIFISRVLATRDLESYDAVREALLDLYYDEDFRKVITVAKKHCDNIL